MAIIHNECQIRKAVAKLDMEYDLSFFDTNPYEQVPGGVMSIWPFTIGRFIELPYTFEEKLEEIYSTFLNVMKERAGFWHALPREVASWWNQRDDNSQDIACELPWLIRAALFPMMELSTIGEGVNKHCSNL